MPELRSPACPPQTSNGGPAPRGSFRGRSPAGTCRTTYADRCARLRQTMLLPVHPLRSIRRFQGRGVGRQIALHMCQLLDSTDQCPNTSAVRSRRPALSGFASESHLRSLDGISGPATRPAQHAPLRADLEFRCIVAHTASPARRSAGETPSDRSLRGESRRPDGKATTLRSPRADLAASRG